jgi:L-arabinose transport system permease protein
MAALLVNATGNLLYAFAAPLLAGALIGATNGFVIARLGINALITTLATMQIVRGVTRILCNGASVGVYDPKFLALGQFSLRGIGSPIWCMVLAFVIFGFLLNKTVYGRNTLAIGGNTEAARLAGIPVVRTKVLLFALQGIVAAFAGILLASRMTSGQPNTQEGLELKVISACVLGGVSLTGGVGTISGVLVGVLIMGCVQNAMDLKNIPPFWQLVASGGILLAAVLLDKLKHLRGSTT